YQITVTEIAGEKKANYVLPQEGSEESFTISPAEVDYIIADVYSVYGDPAPTLYGSVQNPASVYAEDTLDIVLQTSGIDVGSYPVTGVAGNPNYTVSFYQGTYTIVKRSVELEFSGYDNDGEPREYKHSNFNIFIQATNLVAGDDVRYNPAALTLTKNGLVKNVIRAASYYISVEDDAGNYELTVTGITGEDCDNYDFGGSTLLYTVTPRTLTLTFEGCTNLVYNGNQHIVTAVPGNLVVGDEVLLTYEGASYTNAGTYTVEVTGVNNPNYILPAYTSRIYVISKARPTVSVAATKFEYPYDEHKNYSIEAAASNGEPVQYYLVSGNTLLPTHNSFGSNVGIFTILLTTEENANYLSAEPVEIMIVILETSFSNSIGGQETTVSLANGANPNAGFVNRLAEHQENAVTRYAPVFRDKIVSYVYEAKLMENNIPVDNTGRATITFQLPSTHENLDEATVMFYENGGYVYETVAVNNGTITFTMEELGEFALLGDKDLSPRIIESANYKMTFMVLGVLGAIALTVLLISWFAVIRKTKQSHII
ncbi:MAG: MBG domain-containing protein, partial [Clostridia bacterium]|nr:MBG domain-containing protein [Clostridia bacterium]